MVDAASPRCFFWFFSHSIFFAPPGSHPLLLPEAPPLLFTVAVLWESGLPVRTRVLRSEGVPIQELYNFFLAPAAPPVHADPRRDAYSLFMDLAPVLTYGCSGTVLLFLPLARSPTRRFFYSSLFEPLTASSLPSAAVAETSIRSHFLREICTFFPSPTTSPRRASAPTKSCPCTIRHINRGLAVEAGTSVIFHILPFILSFRPVRRH